VITFKTIADQMVSVFENETTSLQYGYIENLNDGRGYTAGRAGFVTRDGIFFKSSKLTKVCGARIS
jgi:hypothetical protein